MKFDKSKSVWYERYKPQTLEDVILPQSIKNTIISFVKNGDMPNLGFWSCEPGLGKSSTANAIIKDLGSEALWINASLEKGIDTLRGKIHTFASQVSFNNNFKIVVMDECLEENEEVTLLKTDNSIYHVKLKDMDKNTIYRCKSLNLKTHKIENDLCHIVSDRIACVYEITLENGFTIKATDNHPFIIFENDKYKEKTINKDLKLGDKAVLYKGDNNISDSKIVDIKKIGNTRVLNLTVHKNHTIISKNGIITHNCDNISKDSQAAFRGFLDEFSQNCRFIFTGNYKDKIIEPLIDRLSNYDFALFDKNELAKPIFERLKFILENENIEYDKRDLAKIVYTYYPKIRSMIGFLQKASLNGKLQVFDNELNDSGTYEAILKNINGDYTELVKNINKLTSPSNMYTYIYNNAEKYFSKQAYPNAIVICAKYQSYDNQVRDKHLNLCACMTELMRL